MSGWWRWATWSRGAAPGFYVRERVAHPSTAATPPSDAIRNIDVTWLLRSMFHSAESHKAPGWGFLPNEWLDGELMSGALRSLGRQPGNHFLSSGTPQGFPAAAASSCARGWRSWRSASRRTRSS